MEEQNQKITTLNTYDLINQYLQTPNLSNHISKHLSPFTLKPVDSIFASLINDSFIILKFQESQKSSQYFKYDILTNNFDRLDISSSKSIIDIGYNKSYLYYILSIGNTYTILTQNQLLNYENLILKDSIKLSNEIGKKYIIKISCGEKHCLFLTHAGMVYTLGDNSKGQLGIGENHLTKENKDGVLLKDLLNYRINDIQAGKNHSICFGVVREMTKAGNNLPNNSNVEFDPKRPYYLFGWGDNTFYQLGMKQINSSNIILKPSKISCNNNLHNPAIIGEELINICTGNDFNALLFKNGKLLTFGNNQYNQSIYKENKENNNEGNIINNVNNYLPKKIGKIVKIISGGDSLGLISEFNKLIIFGKFNEPNIDQICEIDLMDNYDNYKYVLNNNYLKLIFFNNDSSNNIKIIQNITYTKIKDFLVNINFDNNNKNEKETKNQNAKINSNTNASNNITNNNKIDNKTIEVTNPNKRHIKLKSAFPSSIPENTSGTTKPELKKQISKNFGMKNYKNIKYKNSFIKTSQVPASTNNNKRVIDSSSIYQKSTSNLKNKIEIKKQLTPFNGAEKKNDNIKYNNKIYESNGNNSNNQSKNNNDNSQGLKLNIDNNDNKKDKVIIANFESSSSLKNEDININLKEKELNNNNSNKSNGNNVNIDGIKNNENGNIIQNKIDLDKKTFLNTNLLKNKQPIISSKNRYEDNMNDSYNNKEKNIINNNKNGGSIKNGLSKENKIDSSDLTSIIKVSDSDIKAINCDKEISTINKAFEQSIETKIDKNINLNSNNNIYSNNVISSKNYINNNDITKLENIVKNTNYLNNNDKSNIIITNIEKPNLKYNNNVQNNNNKYNVINNDIKNTTYKNNNNIDNNISNNSIKNVIDFRSNKIITNNNKDDQDINKLKNIDNNSMSFNSIINSNINSNILKNQSIKINNNNINNNIVINNNNGINNKNNNIMQINNNINTRNDNFKINDINNIIPEPKVTPIPIIHKKNNISISKKSDNEKLDIFKNINPRSKNNSIYNNSFNNGNNNGNIIKTIPIQINNSINSKNNSQENKNNTTNEEGKKENTNIFREFGQFVTSTMNKINKYTKNRTDIKKDNFFETLLTGNFSINLRKINPKILINNIMTGVPNRYRGRFWLKCIGNQLSITPDYFDINLSKFYEKYEETKESRYKLPFPYLGIFKEGTPLTSDLCEVINGFLISRPDIKYNEKISYLVGMLIINMDKYQAYVAFMNLILNPNIIIYYLPTETNEPIMEYGYCGNTPGGEGPSQTPNPQKKIPAIVEKNLRRVIFKQLLFHNLPDLCSNLELINVLPEDYFDEWNETIFCKNFNIDIGMKIWDLFVVQGQKIIFDAGIALMKELENDLNNCEEKEEALEILLKSQMREINENNVMKNIMKVEYPEWIQSEVLNLVEGTAIQVNFNNN